MPSVVEQMGYGQAAVVIGDHAPFHEIYRPNLPTHWLALNNGLYDERAPEEVDQSLRLGL